MRLPSTALLALALSLNVPTLAQDPPKKVPAPAQEVETPPIPADTEIVTTESGLKYSGLKEGDGSIRPAMGDRVRVHYTGWLTDGTVFDSSRQRGEPTEFALGSVIPGWNEGLKLMSPGARYKFTIPADLAYGEKGNAPVIPAGATLIFDVELLAVVAHSMPFIPWQDEGANAVEDSPVRYRVLSAGKGAEAGDFDLLLARFGFWSEKGELIFSDVLMGRELLVSPQQPPIPFLGSLLPVLSDGAHLIVKLPKEELPQLAQSPTYAQAEFLVAQFQVMVTMKFDKPEFTLPPDEELTTTASGLRYKILREGCAGRPTPRNRVAAHYAGWLTDGKGFDASYDRGQPLQGSLMGLVKGWQEGMCLIGRGGKILLVVPPELGYGAQDKGTIPPNSTLVFVVELIDFG